MNLNKYCVAAIAASFSSSAFAFTPTSTSSRKFGVSHKTTSLQSHSNKNNENMFNEAKSALTSAALAGLLWVSPMAATVGLNNDVVGNNNNMLLENIRTSVVSDAKEMASASGSRVNKDADSLLRYGLPINNKEVRELQAKIEGIVYDIGSKRKTAALDGVKAVKSILKGKTSKIVAGCNDSKLCQSYIDQMTEELDPLTESLQSSLNSLNGSEQERTALDKAYKSQIKLADFVGKIEEQMIPPGYQTPVPSDYDDLPQLKGRAVVEFVVEKPDNGPFDIDGTNYDKAIMKMVIDGYTAPVTGGNFIDLVNKGFYTGMQIQRSDGFVVQTGKPNGKAEGYTEGKPSKSVGAGPNGERQIPLEIFAKGDKGPFYETTIEDEGRGGEATVLPFSSFGAMGWARDEYDPNSGSSQFFWLLFDSDLTPAGKNVLDGRYPCFGYVVEGADFLRDVKEGDIIKTAKVTSGLDLLQQPN